jgi:hypothetical protein
MQFKVPQFLEIEDKIFGPFTFREFVYLAGGAGICFALYKLLGLVWGAIPILAVGSLSGMLTFYRPNNKPFIEMLEAGFKYGFQSKLYIWKRRQVKKDVGTKGEPQNMSMVSEEEKRKAMLDSGLKLSGNKLRDLAWSLDVLDLKKNT